jgi:NADH-quinone oxidoreductase chain G
MHRSKDKEIKLFINKKTYIINKHLTLIQACSYLGIEIPRFCYHEKLTIAGNCRMCLLEVSRNERGVSVPKPVASCAIPALEGMHIHNNTVMVKKARESVLEFLLINHPLDCPICDQGGECDLQDQTMIFGNDRGRFYENKRSVVDKYCGPLIKTIMTRCIHCTRCVRFGSEIAGVNFLGTTGRGYNTEISSYINQLSFSEISGNVIDLCPVGALTSKPYAFAARSWELKSVESIDVLDSIGSNIRIDVRGSEIMRILPRLNESLNEDWITDKTRFFYDGLKVQKLQTPLIKLKNNFIMCSWSTVFLWLSLKIKLLKNKVLEINGIVSNLSDNETIITLKDFLNIKGSSNFYIQDYNHINFDFRQNFLLNISLLEIEKLDFVILVGLNPRLELPLLNLRFRKSVKYNKSLIVSLGFSYPLTYNYLSLGSNIINLIQILEGTSMLCKVFLKSKNRILAFGNVLSKRLDVDNLLNVFKTMFLKLKLNNCLNFINNYQGSINCLELGFSNPINHYIRKNKKLKLFFLCGIDDSMFIKKNKEKNLYIYIGSTGNNISDICDIILPACNIVEKQGHFINIEGRVQKTKFIKLPLGLSRTDWKIFISFLCFSLIKPNSRILKPRINRLLEISPIYKKIFYNLFIKYNLKIKKDKIVYIYNSNILSPFLNYYASDVISKSSYLLAITSKHFIKNKNFIYN